MGGLNFPAPPTFFFRLLQLPGRSGIARRVTLDVTRNGDTGVNEVIVSYRDKRTEDFARGEFVKAFSGIERPASKKLDQLEAATNLGDLAALRSNHFEKLSGDRARQYSVRINLKWRICFEWPKGSGGPANVEITDYH
jgi:proteic killer suppression protein